MADVPGELQAEVEKWMPAMLAGIGLRPNLASIPAAGSRQILWGRSKANQGRGTGNRVVWLG